MPENKDELLKKQNEEIQKLKKELKQASKPSSMFSVLKNTVKRNVHDFFIREDRMKNMDSKIKNLEKELAKKEEELNKTSAELFAAVNLGESDTTSNRSDENSGDNPESEPDSPTQDGPVFPQTAEDAVKEYFGPIDLAQLARYYYPETSKPKTSEGLESPDEEPSSQISTEPENMGNSVPADAKSKSQEQAPLVLNNKEEAEKELPKTEPRPEPVLKETKKPEKTEKKEKDNQVSERKIAAITTALSQTKAVVDAENAPKEKTPEPQTPTKSAGLNPRSKSGNESSFAGELSMKSGADSGKAGEASMKSGNETGKAGELSISVKKAEKNDAASPGRAKTDTPKINKKNTSTQNKEEKDSKPTQLEKQPEVKQSETGEQVKGSAAVTNTATVVDKNGKKKSRKDRRKQKKNTQNPEVQSTQPVAKTENNNTVANPGQEKPFSEPDFTESAEPDIDLPDDFGIVMEPEEPLPSDLPDINSGSGNIFDDLFNSDSDNWDDSNI